MYIRPEDIAEKLEKARPSNGGWVALCPIHEDKNPSLKISAGERGTVVYCHAGCDTAEILATLGYQMQMLFYDYRQNNDTVDLRGLLNNMVEERRPPVITPELERLDDVMYEALISDLLDEQVWIEALSLAGIEYPMLMGLSYPEAMRYSVIVGDGPLFTFLRPLWESADRPDWTELKHKAFIKMAQVYREAHA